MFNECGETAEVQWLSDWPERVRVLLVLAGSDLQAQGVAHLAAGTSSSTVHQVQPLESVILKSPWETSFCFSEICSMSVIQHRMVKHLLMCAFQVALCHPKYLLTHSLLKTPCFSLPIQSFPTVLLSKSFF